jgi:hypothetical protein
MVHMSHRRRSMRRRSMRSRSTVKPKSLWSASTAKNGFRTIKHKHRSTKKIASVKNIKYALRNALHTARPAKAAQAASMRNIENALSNIHF